MKGYLLIFLLALPAALGVQTAGGLAIAPDARLLSITDEAQRRRTPDLALVALGISLSVQFGLTR